MNDLIAEYCRSLERVRQGQKRIQAKRGEPEQLKEQLRLLKGMERDLLWVIQWLEQGRQPEPSRGMENRSRIQREVLWSQMFESEIRRMEWMESQRERAAYQEKYAWVYQLLTRLSKSEYEAFVAVRGEGLSFQDTAQLLNCSKSSVQSYVRRAEQKSSNSCGNNINITRLQRR